jgi:hypothetical protein
VEKRYGKTAEPTPEKSEEVFPIPIWAGTLDETEQLSAGLYMIYYPPPLVNLLDDPHMLPNVPVRIAVRRLHIGWWGKYWASRDEMVVGRRAVARPNPKLFAQKPPRDVVSGASMSRKVRRGDSAHDQLLTAIEEFRFPSAQK